MTDAELDSRLAEDGRPGFQTRDILRYFAVDLILAACVRLLLDLGFFPSPDFYVSAVLAGKAVLFFYLVWIVRDSRAAWPETGAATLGKWRGWLAAFAVYAVAYPVVAAADRLNIDLMVRMYRRFGLHFEPQIQDAVLFIFDGTLGAPVRLLLVLFAVAAGPVMEELAFRGVGLDAYARSRGTATALVWTSFLFGLSHLTMQTIIPLSIMGAAFCVARLASGSLWCAAAVHCFHNLLALALVARRLGMVDFPWFS